MYRTVEDIAFAPGVDSSLLCALLDYTAPIGAASTTQLDRKFFALSDSTRRGVLKRLGSGPATIGELAERFGLTLNGVKKHVGILEEVDLVVTTKVGRTRQCRLGPAELRDVRQWIESYRRIMDARLDSFSAYADAKARKDK